ncbi:MAG: hypothetical protein ABI781_20775 [Burkholderiales bacterium]
MGGGCNASAPHFAQKRPLVRFRWPQARQARIATVSSLAGAAAPSAAPQARQNLASSAFSVPHFEQPLDIGSVSCVMEGILAPMHVPGQSRQLRGSVCTPARTMDNNQRRRIADARGESRCCTPR